MLQAALGVSEKSFVAELVFQVAPMQAPVSRFGDGVGFQRQQPGVGVSRVTAGLMRRSDVGCFPW